MRAVEWGILLGVVTSGLLALAPWMFMVHAKLAVIAAAQAQKAADYILDVQVAAERQVA